MMKNSFIKGMFVGGIMGAALSRMDRPSMFRIRRRAMREGTGILRRISDLIRG